MINSYILTSSTVGTDKFFNSLDIPLVDLLTVRFHCTSSFSSFLHTLSSPPLDTMPISFTSAAWCAWLRALIDRSPSCSHPFPRTRLRSEISVSAAWRDWADVRNLVERAAMETWGIWSWWFWMRSGELMSDSVNNPGKDELKALRRRVVRVFEKPKASDLLGNG